MKTYSIKSVLGIALLSLSGAATAATVNDYVTFSATGFSSFPTTVAVPTDPVTGAFTITFDPTQSYSDPTTTGITLKTLNIPLDSALAFTYSPTGPFAGELVVGGSNAGASAVIEPPLADNDFYLHIIKFSSSPTFQQLGYTSSCSTGTCGYFYTDGVNPTGHGSVSVTPITAVPLPASLPLFGAALGIVGLLGLSRKRNASATFGFA